MVSALGPVMRSAKDCVSDADHVSRATLTFSPSGILNDVTVTGWAADNGKSECIKTAFKGIRVPPFTTSTFSTLVTIRP